MTEVLITSEAVSRGHPDKISDQISDGILDLYLSRDAESRCGIEALVTTNLVVLAGEARSKSPPSRDEIEAVVRTVIREIGYTQHTFSPETVVIQNHIHSQSEDIASGVDATATKAEGAGDQGMMFGYACRDTDNYMPAAHYYAHRILKELELLRHLHPDILQPDAKAQVTVAKAGDRVLYVDTVVVSTQHSANAVPDTVNSLSMQAIRNAIPAHLLVGERAKYFINPTGRFVIGGPDGDTGLTGRKIVVDTYGGSCPHGGGAFSGKDPTKVDRSAAYMARYLAKNIVAACEIYECRIQLSYIIGVSQPASLAVETGNSKLDELLVDRIKSYFDLSPKGIRTFLRLNRPGYINTAHGGHFGVEDQDFFSWEALNSLSVFKDL